ncbi:fructose-1,6-bisphosphatase, partial [Candidatus Bathyarchaeota archaeon]
MVARKLRELLETEDRSLSKLVDLLAELSLRIVREIPRTLGMTEGVNIYGEQQTELDVWSNGLLTKRLLRSGLVRQVASEEMETVMSADHGEYTVALDPLDGSSNIRTNNLMGTIVGIYHDKALPASGRDLLSALYFLYGPYVEAVVGVKSGVYLAAPAGTGSGASKFISNGEPHRLPQKGSVYGIGGSRDKWTEKVREFANRLERRKLKFRYGGSFVGDYNQVLCSGGFFAYPELLDAPDGKYRLQFESNPIGYITERAGGKASTGKGNILD